MLNSDRYSRKLQSQRCLNLSQRLKIKIPCPITKRLTNYKSWRNFNGSAEKLSKPEKENCKPDSMQNQPNNPTYQRFIKAYLKQKGLTSHDYRKQSENFLYQRSAIDILRYKATQSQQCQDKTCSIYVGHRVGVLKYKVSTVGNLVSFLSGSNCQILTYKTVKKDLSIDYCLTLDSMDASFLNGTSVNLVPIYRAVQDIITINSFEIIHCIGTGGFSKVFLVRFLEDGKLYAMKVINKEFIVKNKKKRIVINERNIMKELNNHPFIVKMKFSFESRQSLIFIMEYCPGGQLFNLVKRFRRMKQDVAKFYIIQTLLGLEKVHEENIIYRDFKPENILIDIDGHIRIADFGLAKPDIHSNKDRATSFCGSPQYMPPEMILKNGHSFPVDFYCIGALLYELVTGLPPFYSKDPNKIYQSTICENLTFPNHTYISRELRQLLLGLLQKDQKLRLGSLSGVREVLAHPWFGKINRKEYLQRKIKPPVSFSGVGDFNFTFEEIKDDNDQFVSDMKRQQRDQSRKYPNIMNNFYYDHRQNDGNQKERATLPYEKGFSSMESLNSTRDSKRRHTNILSTRSKTRNTKLKKQPISVENRMIFKNKVY